MLNDDIRKSITTELSALFGKITVSITTASIDNTLAKKQQNLKKQAIKDIKNKFLQDKSLQELEKIFSSKTNIETIKSKTISHNKE